MKHLKLLGLLTAVMMTVFSYGQDGTGGIVVSDSTAGGSITLWTSYSETAIEADEFGGLMAGEGYVVGLAYNLTSVHGHFGSNSSFYILDPSAIESTGGVNASAHPSRARARAIMNDSTGGGIMDHLLKDADFDVMTTPEAPMFYFMVIYYGPVGRQFVDTLWISAQGVDPIPVVFTATLKQTQPIDTTVVDEPFLYVNPQQLTLTGANASTGSLAHGIINVNVGNVETLLLQMQNGANITLGDPEGYLVPSMSYNVNYSPSETYQITVLLNTWTAGRYQDVLTISAPGTNLQPIQVQIFANVDGGVDTTAAYLNVPPVVQVEGYQMEMLPIGYGELPINVGGVQQFTATWVDGTHFTFVDIMNLHPDGTGGVVVGDSTGNVIIVAGQTIPITNTFTMPLYGRSMEMSLPILLYTSQIGTFVDTILITTAELDPIRVVVVGNVTEYVMPDTAAIGLTEHYLEMKVQGAGSAVVGQVTGYALGVTEIHARISNGSPFYLLSPDETEDGSHSYAQEIVIPLDSSLISSMGVYQFRLNTLFVPDSFGVYIDTLWVWADNTAAVPQYVVLYGEASDVQPQQGNFYTGATSFTLSKGVMDQNTPSTYLKFHSENNDMLNIMFTEGNHFRIRVPGNDSLLYAGLTLYGDEINLNSQLEILFFGNEVGDYVDTLWFYPSNAQPVMVVFYGHVYDNSQPMFSIETTFTDITVPQYADLWESMGAVEAHVENINSIRISLLNGSHFRLVDVLQMGEMISIDSTAMKTSMVMDSLYSAFVYNNRWMFFFVLLTDVVGDFTDTMKIEPYGLDEVYMIPLYGHVTGESTAMTWTDNNVIVTFRNDSLIVSGTGSTSDYSEYNNAPWIDYIINNFNYYEFPHNLLIEPGVTRLGDRSMYNMPFHKIDLTGLDSLGSQVFCYADMIDTLILPATLDYIGCGAFYENYARVVINNLRPDVAMCDNPFYYFHVTDGVVIANTMQLLEIYSPRSTSVESDNDSIIDLYVAYGYRYDHREKGYDIIAHDYLTLDEDTISALPTLPTMAIDYSLYDTTYCGHVNMPISATLHLSKLLKKDFWGYTSPFSHILEQIMWGWTYFDPGTSGVMTSLIVDGMMSADTIELREKVYPRQWHFMGLPFNQRVSEIGITNHSYYCIRRFDGARQALGQIDSVWVDVEDNETLHAGDGFILQVTNRNWAVAELSFKAQDDAQKQNIFTPSVQSLPLTQYPAEQVWNANWNLVANPYPCFYDTRKIANGGIITVWSSNNGKEGEYFASYSVDDDYYVLQPGEAFLYQAAAGEVTLRMPLDGRQHSTVPAGVSEGEYGEDWLRSPERATRTLLNFYLEQNNNKDRARVVLNENASMGYEVGVDAAKMFVPGATAAQLYAEQGDAKLSILERPLGNGMVYLGVRLMEEGECTISIPEAKGMDITLLDTETGVLTDLSHGDYTFYGVPGENSRRFIIGFVGDATLLEFFANSTSDSNVVKVIENGHVYIIRGSEKFDVLGNKH